MRGAALETDFDEVRTTARHLGGNRGRGHDARGIVVVVGGRGHSGRGGRGNDGRGGW